MIHGESRSSSKQLTPEEIKQKQEKAEKINFHIRNFLEARKNLSQHSKETLLEMTFNLAQMSPEISTIYNVRRELLTKAIEELPEKSPERYEKIVKEIELVNFLLKKQPKSYSLFTHRQWLILQGRNEESSIGIECENGIINKELGFCAKMLEKDERNFHVWNYRNWLITLGGDITYSKKEEAYTRIKMEQNFTNFSALHFRGINFVRYYEKYRQTCENEDEKLEIMTYKIPLKIIASELELISTALFMQTNEQGIWQYHRWLIELILPIKISHIIYLPKQTENCQSHVFLLILSNKVRNFTLNQIEIKINQDKLLEDLAGIQLENLSKIDFSCFYALKISKKTLEDAEKLQIQGKNPNFFLNDNEFPNKFLHDINNKRYFLSSSFNFSKEKSGFSLNDFNYRSTNDMKYFNLEQKLIENSKKMVEEISELEENNKFVLLEKNFLLENTRKDIIDKETTKIVLNNLKILQENYQKQRNMFKIFVDFYEARLEIEEKIEKKECLNNDILKYVHLERFEEILMLLLCKEAIKWEDLLKQLKNEYLLKEI